MAWWERCNPPKTLRSHCLPMQVAVPKELAMTTKLQGGGRPEGFTVLFSAKPTGQLGQCRDSGEVNGATDLAGWMLVPRLLGHIDLLSSTAFVCLIATGQPDHVMGHLRSVRARRATGDQLTSRIPYVLNPFTTRSESGLERLAPIGYATGRPDGSFESELFQARTKGSVHVHKEEIGSHRKAGPPGREELCIAMRLPIGRKCAEKSRCSARPGTADFIGPDDIAAARLELHSWPGVFRRIWRQARFGHLANSRPGSFSVPRTPFQDLRRSLLEPAERKFVSYFCADTRPYLSAAPQKSRVHGDSGQTHRRIYTSNWVISLQSSSSHCFLGGLTRDHSPREGWRKRPITQAIRLEETNPEAKKVN